MSIYKTILSHVGEHTIDTKAITADTPQASYWPKFQCWYLCDDDMYIIYCAKFAIIHDINCDSQLIVPGWQKSADGEVTVIAHTYWKFGCNFPLVLTPDDAQFVTSLSPIFMEVSIDLPKVARRLANDIDFLALSIKRASYIITISPFLTNIYTNDRHICIGFSLMTVDIYHKSSVIRAWPSIISEYDDVKRELHGWHNFACAKMSYDEVSALISGAPTCKN